MKSARQQALETLLKIEKDNSYSNLSIAGVLKENSLQDADKAFFMALVKGIIERKITLDFELEKYLSQPKNKLKPEVLTILRLGAYQILFMDKVPNHAAINESVELAKKNKSAYASGLVNAVLRKVSQNGRTKIEKTDDVNFLEVEYSCPKELINLWISAYGLEKTKGILEHSIGPQKTYIRKNPLKVSSENLTEILPEGALESDPAFKAGEYHIQDLASQLCCEALGALPGETILDVCAAPGGKSFTIAEIMEDKGQVLSFDLYPHRVKLIEEGAKRLGLAAVKAMVGDAEQYNPEIGKVDRVICDVPCAGFGDIGRKPEIRYKSVTSVENLPLLQYNILNISSKYLKVNGTLLYSTCSLNPKENEEVVAKFLEENSNFELKEQKTIFPQDFDCDGFFYSVMTKIR